jgi:hypothetical protein
VREKRVTMMVLEADTEHAKPLLSNDSYVKGRVLGLFTFFVVSWGGIVIGQRDEVVDERHHKRTRRNSAR